MEMNDVSSIEEMLDSIDALISWRDCNAGAFPPQEIYVMEEAGEVVQAMCKLIRHPADEAAIDHAEEEVSDAICTMLAWLRERRIPLSRVCDTIIAKIERAINGRR